MTDDRSNARLIELFDELLGSGRADYAGEIVRRTVATRQRPAWMFPGRWLPAPRLPRPEWLTPLPVRPVMAAVILGLLVLALALAAFVASRPRLPAPFGPAGNGRIAYASGGEIWMADSTESARRILITGPESDNIPAYSPLGDRVAFLRHPNPFGTVGPFHLMVAAADGSQIRQLSAPMVGLNGIAWAPDESSIAFGQSIDSIPAIVLYPPDGAPPRVLDLGVPAEAPAWRPPDGRQLAFLGLVDGHWMIHIAAADGSDVRNLGLPSGPLWWSPDGRFLTFDGKSPGADPEDETTRIHVAEVGPSGDLVEDRTVVFDPHKRTRGSAGVVARRQLACVRPSPRRPRDRRDRPGRWDWISRGRGGGPFA